MKKILYFILGIVLIALIGYYIYALIVGFGSQRMSVVTPSDTLNNFVKVLQKETNSGAGTFIKPIPQYKLDSCNANLELHIHIFNDSISQYKNIQDEYIHSVNQRVNQRLSDKNCIDSLIIEVSSHSSQEKVDSLKTKRYRYSFPVN